MSVPVSDPMNFIHFYGHKKTAESILDSIKSMSSSPKELLENLYSLNVFNSCTHVKNKVCLSESPNTIKMKLSSKSKNNEMAMSKNIIVNFPNVFGGGEFFNLSFQSYKDAAVEIGKPLFLNGSIAHTKIAASRNVREINDKEVDIKKIELGTKFNNALQGAISSLWLGLGFEKIQKLDVLYSHSIFKAFGTKVDTKLGMTRADKLIPFLKVVVGRKLCLEGNRLFFETGLKLGKIFGQTSLVEKFFLGDTLRGYKKESIGPVNQNKKIGGNSFIEIRNKIGFYINKFEVFAFGDVGVNSVKGFGECSNILMSFGDNNCIGKSVGVGVSMKNKKGPSFIFAVPLTSSSDCEKYVVGVDFEF